MEKETREESKIEVIDKDPSELPEIESKREDLIDYEKYRLNKCKIESIEIVRVKSAYSKALDKKVHRLRIIGEIVETATTKEGEKIEFKPSELIGLVEDDNGKLMGLPESEESQWGKIKKAVGGDIKSPKDLIGKELPIRVNESKDGNKYLGFMY